LVLQGYASPAVVRRGIEQLQDEIRKAQSAWADRPEANAMDLRLFA